MGQHWARGVLLDHHGQLFYFFLGQNWARRKFFILTSADPPPLGDVYLIIPGTPLQNTRVGYWCNILCYSLPLGSAFADKSVVLMNGFAAICLGLVSFGILHTKVLTTFCWLFVFTNNFSDPQLHALAMVVTGQICPDFIPFDNFLSG